MPIIPITKASQTRRVPYDVVDGIRYFTDKMGNARELCVTTEAKTRRRQQIYDRADGRCEKCFRPLRFESGTKNSMHWHHIEENGMGGANNNDAMSNAACLCSDCHLAGEHHQF